MAETIFICVLVWMLVALAFFFISLITETTDLFFDSREGIAKLILWPLTIVFYIILGAIWVCKHFFDTILAGFWDFIKHLPKTIKEL